MSLYEPIESTDSRRHLQLRSPVTLEPTGELVCANAEDVEEAIRRARCSTGLGRHQHERALRGGRASTEDRAGPAGPDT